MDGLSFFMILAIAALGFFLLIVILEASLRKDDDWDVFPQKWRRIAYEEKRIRRIAREEIEENIPARYRYKRESKADRTYRTKLIRAGEEMEKNFDSLPQNTNSNYYT